MSRPGAPRILVTGGCGFIGIHAVRALVADGFEVLVVDDLRHACGPGLPGEASLVTSELSTRAAQRAIRAFRPRQAIHLAAQGGVLRSLRDPATDARANVVSTAALLRTCVDVGVERVLFASSGGAIYGRAARLPTAESATPRPLSPYGAAKLACEGYLGMFDRTFGLHSLAMRFGNVYGPHQDGTGEAGVVAISSHRLIAGQPPIVRGDGNQTRDFVYVGDVVEALLAGLAAPAVGSVNIGSGVATAINDVVSRLIDVSGFDVTPLRVPGTPGEVRRGQLDVERAACLLGWRARTALPAGLERTFASFLT